MSDEQTNLRSEQARAKRLIQALIEEDRYAEAFAELKAYWRSTPSLSNAVWVGRVYAGLAPHLASLVMSKRIQVLRSFTLEPILPLVRAEALLYNIDVTFEVGLFNTWAQDLIGPPSAETAPCDMAILALRVEDFRPALFDRFTALSDDQAESLVRDAQGELQSCIAAYAARTSMPLVIHNFAKPSKPAWGVLDQNRRLGQRSAIERLNQTVANLGQRNHGLYSLDYDALVAHHGHAAWHDATKGTSYAMPFASGSLLPMAREWLKFIVPLAGRSIKAIVVDLDDTLWGGTAGEDGISGVRLDPTTTTGAAHLALQKVLLDLTDRGILLAISSKNNAADALEIIDGHPAMLLRSKHFAAMRINWDTKAQNIIDIARELNIGVDHIAFVDNDAAERRSVQMRAPDVFVVDLPENPTLYAATVREQPVFERLHVTAEDTKRNVFYAQQRERHALLAVAVSREDFLASLDMRITISPVLPKTIPRASQLTQKTNQFNLTTKRYSERDLERLEATPGWHLYQVDARDRFGDNGTVGIAIAHDDGDHCMLDTLLLSCRVIGRDIETALLASVAQAAQGRGLFTLKGTFRPTNKNQIVADLYDRHGFQKVWADGAESRWAVTLPHATLTRPDWIIVESRMMAMESA